MFLKKINELDTYSGEADVVISDGQYEIICYCHPFENYKLGSLVTKVCAIFTTDIMRIDDKQFVVKNNGHYSYYFHGKVVDACQGLISIGSIIIHLDNAIAKDIKNGEFIEFKVERLSCIIN